MAWEGYTQRLCKYSSFHENVLFSRDTGSNFWTEEQSRRNFETVSKLVIPGAPLSSPFLLHPLAPEAGGAEDHGGGRQFASKDDPDWKIVEAWVLGEKAGSSSTP